MRDGEKENLIEFLKLNEIVVQPLFPVTSNISKIGFKKRN